MQMFEQPYTLISVLVIAFLLIGGIVVYFLTRGLKTSNYEKENEFANITKLESSFSKAGKHRETRCVMYISVFMDNYRSL